MIPHVQRVLSEHMQASSPAPMPIMHEHWCKLCKLDFPTEAALQHHYKNESSPWHPKCLRCHEGFQNHELLDDVSALSACLM